MQYLLMIYTDEKGMQALPPEQNGAVLAAYGAYMGAMADAGVSKGGQRLHPTSTAATVRVKNGKTQVVNGPYAEIKEQLGGYFLIDAPDLDSAISWAARCPGAQYGAIEVRPIWEMEAVHGHEAVHERGRRPACIGAERTSTERRRVSPVPLSKRAAADRLSPERGVRPRGS